MKILYAAGNRYGARFQMQRILASIANKNNTIQIAAYKKSMLNSGCNYNLDSLSNYTSPNSDMSFNDNYSYYAKLVSNFNPDLIISDSDPFTSMLAGELNKKLWIISTYNGINIELGLYSTYKNLFATNAKYHSYFQKLAEKRFVLSHICDIEKPPKLYDGFEYIRPPLDFSSEHTIDDKENIIYSSKNVLINTSLSNVLINDGTPSFLADAFYNQKFCYSYPRYDDIETIFAANLNAHYKLGSVMQENQEERISIKLNDNVKFISEYL